MIIISIYRLNMAEKENDGMSLLNTCPLTESFAPSFVYNQQRLNEN